MQEKNRLHSKFKKSKNDSDGIKFSLARKEFKKLVEQKMRDNLYEADDGSHMNKKFWAHVKSTAKSQRIPEIVSYKNCTRSGPQDQAELFNEFFMSNF